MSILVEYCVNEDGNEFHANSLRHDKLDVKKLPLARKASLFDNSFNHDLRMYAVREEKQQHGF